jgi:hypothetical protein
MDVLLRSEPIAFFFELYRSGEPPRIWLLVVDSPLVEASYLLPLALLVIWSSHLILGISTAAADRSFDSCGYVPPIQNVECDNRAISINK